jgi:hypothetical protein
MKFKTIKIFVSGIGLQKLTRKEFIENLDSGLYDKTKIEIVEMGY